MPDFRFDGTSVNGRHVHGVVQAEKRSEAKRKVSALAVSHRFTVDRISQRRTFLYKVRKGTDKPVTGEQKAFTADEVRGALEHVGYTVISVGPKFLDFRLKPPQTDVVSFVRVSADLLREKLPFNEVLQLLADDIENVSLREAIKEITKDLQQGKDSEEAFVRQEKYLGRFAARMLGLASKSGSMAEIYESTATFLERNAEFKKSIKSALVMPMFTVVLLLGVVVLYVAYIFPQTAELFVKMGIELPPMTAATLKFSNFLLGNMMAILGVFLLFAGTVAFLMRLPRVQYYKDKYILRLPVMGPLIHKTAIEIFCRVFYSLYSGAGESVDAIKLSAEACGNKYFEHRLKTVAIPMMLSRGIGLVQSLEASGVFTKMALSRFHSGAETGTIKNSAMQIANYYQKDTVYKLKNVVDFIGVLVAMFIMLVMTGLTFVSSETATITPPNPTVR